MNTSQTSSDDDILEEKSPTETTTSSDSIKKGIKSLPVDLLSLAKDLSIPRLFLILSFVVYAVISFSKGSSGIDEKDFSLFVYFIVFSMTIFGLLIVSRDFYRDSNSASSDNLAIFVIKIIARRKTIILIFLIITISLIIFRKNIYSLVLQFIEKISIP